MRGLRLVEPIDQFFLSFIITSRLSSRGGQDQGQWLSLNSLPKIAVQ